MNVQAEDDGHPFERCACSFFSRHSCSVAEEGKKKKTNPYI